MPGPLAGVKVIDLTAVLLGPFADLLIRTACRDQLDDLPLAGDILPGLPDDLEARLFDAFDLHGYSHRGWLRQRDSSSTCEWTSSLR